MRRQSLIRIVLPAPQEVAIGRTGCVGSEVSRVVALVDSTCAMGDVMAAMAWNVRTSSGLVESVETVGRADLDADARDSGSGPDLLLPCGSM